MSNFHYIIASLPEIHSDTVFDASTPGKILGEILSQCQDKNLDLVLEGSDPKNLCEEFYLRARKSKVKIVRDYFAFDLQVRNAKVRYLNAQLSRPADKDVITLPEEDNSSDIFFEIGTGESFPEADKAAKALSAGDILSRERALDNLYWDKISELTAFNYFDLEAVIGFVLKLKIVARWALLDPQTGKEMFRSIVNEVRGTFQGVKAIS